jgi:hypothetical protein
MKRQSTVRDPSRASRRLVVAALAAACALASVAGTAAAGSGAPTAVQAVEGQAFTGAVATYTSTVTADERFVEQAYLDLLGRNAGQSELTTFAAFLANGGTRTQLGSTLLASDEAREAIVRSAYAAFLNRAADAVGLAAGVALLKAGATDDQLKAFLLGSDEYFSARGGTVPSFLSALYMDVLDRPIDAAAGAAFAQAIASGATRQDVALAVLGSLEAKQDLVEGEFARLLHRAATPGEVQAFVSLLGNSGTDEQLTAAIVGSAEYLAGVPASFATATIDWGDGSPSSTTPVSAGIVHGTHTYADEGSFPITVLVHDLDGAVTIAGTANVADAALSAAPSSLTVAKKTLFTRTVATFTDANPAADGPEFSASIRWGDGLVSTGTVRALRGGGFAVDGSHVYRSTGTYRLAVQVRDEGGSTADAVGAVLVTKKG